MKFLNDKDGEHIAVLCDNCEKQLYKPNPVYRYGHRILCEDCLKDMTELDWWNLEDYDFDIIRID